jgi:hypothetical protein
MHIRVVRLVTSANSVAFLLFHMEQSADTEWFWRWRIKGGYPESYLGWREGASRSRRVIQHSEVAGCELCVEWRGSGGGEWRQAALHRVGAGVADFRVVAKNDFAAPRGFRAMAEVCGMVACYGFGELFLPAGSEMVVEGRADGAFADNVLVDPGEFVSEDAMVRIENVTASSDSLLEAPPGEVARLEVAPGASLRRIFARPYQPCASQVKLQLTTHHG